MPDVVPFAVVQIGVSLALAAVLAVAYRKLTPASFLLYWALYWIAIAASLTLGPMTMFLDPIPSWHWLVRIFGAAGISLFPIQAALMVCAANSLRKKEFCHRTALKLLAAIMAVGIAGGVYHYMTHAGAPRVSPLLTPLRPIGAGLAVMWFALCMARHRGRDLGYGRTGLVLLSLLYGIHNLLLGASGFGLHVYRNGAYSPWAGAVGMLLQFALTSIFVAQAFEQAQEAGAEARESTRRFRSMLEDVGLAGMILDRGGQVTFCNRHLAGLLGCPAEEVEGADWFKTFVPAGELRGARNVFEDGMAGVAWPAMHEYPVLSQDGEELQLQWYHTSLFDRGGAVAGVASLGVDVTQQRVLEDQYRQAQKMETLGRLAGGVAHDFNNHLTAINGFADLLLRKFRAGDPARVQIQHIRTSGGRAADLTRQLLAFGRKQELAAKPLSLNEAVRSAEGMLRRLVREEIDVLGVLAPDLGTTVADAGQVNQILLNLVVNASDAIPGRGRITIRTENFTARAGLEGNGAPGEYVMISVEDNGSGMEPRVRQKIFEPYFTTKDVGKGTGLGLSTVYGIARQAGGWVDVTSEAGTGSIFRVYFPRDMAGEAATAAENVEALAGGQGTVLVVEDQDEVRQLAVEVLSSAGYRVVEVSGASDALRLAADSSVAISMLITDVMMPGMRGDELAGRFKAFRPGTPVLLVSGYAPVNGHGCSRSRAIQYPFLEKPYTPTELCDKVEELLRSRV